VYKLLLTFRYLRRKMIPWFALLAVTLCTAMLIIVLSVMGGFHDLLLNAGTKLMGDVKMFTGVEGIPHYEELLAEIRRMERVEAAVPSIETWGLLKTPDDSIKVVEVIGVNPRELDRVTRFRESLVWDLEKARAEPGLTAYRERSPIEAAMAMDPPWVDVEASAMVSGIELNPYNSRTDEGEYRFLFPWLGHRLELTLVPISAAGAVVEERPESRPFVVVNEFHSGLYEVDSKRVYIPFAEAQRMLLMDPAPVYADPLDPTSAVVGRTPGRCTAISIRAKAGVSPDELRAALSAMYERFHREYEALPAEPVMAIRTWRQLLANLLNTVENEKNLMTFLFGIISFVAVIMVLVIFYMIVLEKTRDIGILRAVGASRPGVASIFLLYAAAIGVVGAVLGTIVAWLIVTYINEIHAWLGKGFGVSMTIFGCAVAGALLMTPILMGIGTARTMVRRTALGSAAGFVGFGLVAAAIILSNAEWTRRLNRQFGFQIWDRTVYFFERIPNEVAWTEVGVIVVAAVAASVLGAVIPAILAARVDPVESLRYE